MEQYRLRGREKGRQQVRSTRPAFKFLDGDGRGGLKKRRQVPLPGPWDTAEDAAVMRAVIIRGFKESGDGMVHSPPKQNKQHKPRVKPSSKPAQPALEPQFRCQWPQPWQCPLQLCCIMLRSCQRRRFRCSPCPLCRSCECVCVHTYPLLKIRCLDVGTEVKIKCVSCSACGEK